MTANGPQENVGLNVFAGVCVNGQISWFALDFGDLGPTVDVYSGVLHPGGEDVLDVIVESLEDSVAVDEEVGLISEGVEDTGEFYGDVTSANDDNSFQLILKVEETIGGDTKAGARDFFIRGNGGATADSYANVMSFDVFELVVCGMTKPVRMVGGMPPQFVGNTSWTDEGGRR